jgi:hypothetical protein
VLTPRIFKAFNRLCLVRALRNSLWDPTPISFLWGAPTEFPSAGTTHFQWIVIGLSASIRLQIIGFLWGDHRADRSAVTRHFIGSSSWIRSLVTQAQTISMGRPPSRSKRSNQAFCDWFEHYEILCGSPHPYDFYGAPDQNFEVL